MFIMVLLVDSLLYCSKDQLKKNALMKDVKGLCFTRNDNAKSSYGDDKFTSVKTSNGQYLHIHPSGKVTKLNMFGQATIGYMKKR